VALFRTVTGVDDEKCEGARVTWKSGANEGQKEKKNMFPGKKKEGGETE